MKLIPQMIHKKRSVEIDISASLLDAPATVTSTPCASPARSLGTGSFGESGRVRSFAANSMTLVCTESSPEITTLKDVVEDQAPVFKRCMSSFLRVADLNIDEMTSSLHSTSEDSSDGSLPNYSFVSSDPPPGIPEDPSEQWVALDDGEGGITPMAPLAVSALAASGQASVLRRDMWTPDHKTAKIIKSPAYAWQESTWKLECAQVPDKDRDVVLVWSGTFLHGRYGSDLPAVRTAGFIPMAPIDLMNLLVDSSRVQEYNKHSLGRTDLLVLQDEKENGPFGGLTKVMRSESKPPVVRKPLQFTSLLHARPLNNGGYLLVSRGVTAPHTLAAGGSEILLGVNLILPCQNDSNYSLLVVVNHVKSSMIPLMIAKRIGLQAAVNFFSDLRACC